MGNEGTTLPDLRGEGLADLPTNELDSRIRSGHAKVEEIREQVGNLMLEGLVAAGQTGAALNERKSRMQYGMWTTWLDRFFPATARTAQNYMRVADNWEYVREEAKRVSEPLSYRRAIRLLQKRHVKQAREKGIEQVKWRIEDAVESDRITEEQASTIRENLLPDADRVDRGQLKPSTLHTRVEREIDRVERDNWPEPKRRSFEAGARFREAYEAGDKFRALLQDLRDADDREWLGTGAALKLASVLTQIQGAAAALMGDIREAAPEDTQIPEDVDAIEVESRESEAA